jgi:hypothetical protein
MSSQTQPASEITKFNYHDLDSQQRTEVEQATAAIKERLRKAAQDIWEIGKMLSDVQSKLQRGQFDDWIETEFDWSRRTAYKFISVYKRFDRDINLEEINIATSALYLLAAESTPEDIRQEFIQKAQEGEKVTHQQVLKVVKQARQQPAEDIPFAIQNNTTPVEKPVVESIKPNSIAQSKLKLERGWYQLESRHQIYCGDTAMPEFVNNIPYAALAIAVTTDDWAHDWLIEKAKTVVVFPESEYDRQKLTGLIVMFSAAEDKIIFPWLPNSEMIAIAHRLGRQIYAGDRDTVKCQAGIDRAGLNVAVS